MLVFQKIWLALFSFYLRFEVFFFCLITDEMHFYLACSEVKRNWTFSVGGIVSKHFT